MQRSWVPESFRGGCSVGAAPEHGERSLPLRGYVSACRRPPVNTKRLPRKQGRHESQWRRVSGGGETGHCAWLRRRSQQHRGYRRRGLRLRHRFMEHLRLCAALEDVAPRCTASDSPPAAKVPANTTLRAFWLMLMNPPAPASLEPKRPTFTLPSASASAMPSTAMSSPPPS